MARPLDAASRRRPTDVQRGRQRRGAARALAAVARALRARPACARRRRRQPRRDPGSTRAHSRRDYPFLRIVRHERNRGMAAALRTGIADGPRRARPGVRRAGLHGRRPDPRARGLAATGRADRRATCRLCPRLALRARRTHARRAVGTPRDQHRRQRRGRDAARRPHRRSDQRLPRGTRARSSARSRSRSTGFGIQLEGTVKAHRAGFRVAEVPITLGVRKNGYSKMAYTRSFWLGYAPTGGRLWLSRRVVDLPASSVLCRS